MESYRLRVSRHLLARIRALNDPEVSDLVNVINSLSGNPRPDNAVPVPDTEGLYVVEAAGYDLIYAVHDLENFVRILELQPRAHA